MIVDIDITRQILLYGTITEVDITIDMSYYLIVLELWFNNEDDQWEPFNVKLCGAYSRK